LRSVVAGETWLDNKVPWSWVPNNADDRSQDPIEQRNDDVWKSSGRAGLILLIYSEGTLGRILEKKNERFRLHKFWRKQLPISPHPQYSDKDIIISDERRSIF
jgi:hypothetical protein